MLGGKIPFGLCLFPFLCKIPSQKMKTRSHSSIASQAPDWIKSSNLLTKDRDSKCNNFPSSQDMVEGAFCRRRTWGSEGAATSEPPLRGYRGDARPPTTFDRRGPKGSGRNLDLGECDLPSSQDMGVGALNGGRTRRSEVAATESHSVSSTGEPPLRGFRGDARPPTIFHRRGLKGRGNIAAQRG